MNKWTNLRMEVIVMKKKTSELHFRADILREEIRNAGLSQNKIAKAMGLDSKTFSFKMNGVTDWKLKEIQYLQKVLNIDVCKVFCFQNKMEG